MRKPLILVTLLFTALFSCKKDPAINPDEVRLLKIKAADSAGNVSYAVFDYDASGRIVKVSGVSNNESPVELSTISYSGNTATVTQTPFTSGPIKFYSYTVYKLSTDNQPLERYFYDSMSVVAPETPQRTIHKDTSKYEYDARGLIKKMTMSFFDSTWFNPGVVEIRTTRRVYNRDYTNEDGMLKGITTHGQEVQFYQRLATQITNNYSIEGSHTFEYTRHQGNVTDFKNAWLLPELGFLYRLEYPLNQFYTHFPDKVSISETTRNTGNGQITSTYNDNFSMTLGHTKYGFISSYAIGTRIQDKRELIYNH